MTLPPARQRFPRSRLWLGLTVAVLLALGLPGLAQDSRDPPAPQPAGQTAPPPSETEVGPSEDGVEPTPADEETDSPAEDDPGEAATAEEAEPAEATSAAEEPAAVAPAVAPRAARRPSPADTEATAAAEAAGEPAASKSTAKKSARTLRSVLKREPLGYDPGETLATVSRDLAGLPPAVQRLVSQTDPAVALYWALGLLLVLVVALLGSRWERRLRDWLAPDSEHWEWAVTAVVRALGQAVVRIVIPLLTPLAAWVVWQAYGGLTVVGGNWSDVIASLIVIWAVCRVLSAFFHEMLIRQQEQLPEDRARALLRRCTQAVQVGGWLMAFSVIAHGSGYNDGVSAALDTLFFLGVGAMALRLLRPREEVLGLIPKTEHGAGRLGMTWVRTVYYPLLVLSGIVLVLHAAGFRELSSLFFARVWALLGIALVNLVVYRVLVRLLGEWLVPEDEEPPPQARHMYATLSRAVSFLLVIGYLASAVEMLELRPVVEGVGGFSPGMVLGARFAVRDVVLAVLGVLVILWASRLVQDLLDRYVYPRTGLEEGEAHSMNRLVGYVAWAFAVLVFLNTLGVPASSLALVAGGLSVGIGLGIQDVAKDLAYGLILLLTRTVHRGDLINVGDLTGTVEEIGIRSTVIRNFDNQRIVVPNNKLAGNNLVNWTLGDHRVRRHVVFKVKAGVGPEQVREVILEATRGADFILQDPPPQVWFTASAASAMEFDLVTWIDVTEHPDQAVNSDLHYLVHHALEAAEIPIA